MRIVGFLVVLALAACGSNQPLQTLSLRWTGVSSTPAPAEPVARAFAAAPFSFSVRDVRQDPYQVGYDEENRQVIRTPENVAGYCSQRMGDMLARAGARFDVQPVAQVEAELLEYNVNEAGMFTGAVRIRTVVKRPAGAWAKIYIGKSKRWGKSHNPDNYNEALSNALHDVTTQLVQDPEFAHALAAEQMPTPPPVGPAGPAI